MIVDGAALVVRFIVVVVVVVELTELGLGFTLEVVVLWASFCESGVLIF